MNITINDKPFIISQYDNNSSVIARYIKTLNDNWALPEFFVIKNQDFIFKDGSKLQIHDIRGDLPKNLNMLKDFNGTKVDELAIIWMTLLYPTKELLVPALTPTLLKKLFNYDIINFSTKTNVIRLYGMYLDKVTKIREKIWQNLKDWDSNIECLPTKTMKVMPFKVNKTTVSIVFDVPRGVNLLNIFDSMNVSKNIPLLVLVSNNKVLYKVFSDINLSRKMIFDDRDDGLYFYTCDSKHKYTMGLWNEQNEIKIEYDIKDKGDKIVGILIKSLQDRINVNAVQKDQIGIGGYFDIKFSFNPVIFADLITINPCVSNILYLDELKKTATEKKYFTFSYRLWNGRTVGVSIIIYRMKKTLWSRITIKKALKSVVTLQDVKIIMSIFSRVAYLYSIKQASIYKEYKMFVSNLNEYKKIKQVDVEIRKTGAKLSKLNKILPNMFVKGEYSTRCQKNRQPIHLNKKEMRDYHAKHPFKDIMRFPPEGKHYYICESDSKLKKRYNFPGLQLNSMSNKENYKYIPCCFVNSQKTRNKSIIDAYKDRDALQNKMLEDMGALPDDIKIKGYIKDDKKAIVQGRAGDIPFYLKQIFGANIFRLGVMESPSSFIHCMGRALNPEYINLKNREKEDHVKMVRSTIAKSNFSFGKQELFDISDERIAEILNDHSLYLDPSWFISLVSRYYNCNIFLYTQSSEHPCGKVLIPRHSQAYLIHKARKIPTVLILERKYEGFKQCELLVLQKNTIITDFKGTEIPKKALKLLYSINKVSTVVPTFNDIKRVRLSSYSSYIPLGEVVSQFIDVDGKTRMLNYKGLSMMILPIPPLDKKIGAPDVASLKTLTIFLKKRNLKIMSQEVVSGIVYGVWVKGSKVIGYIPTNFNQISNTIVTSPMRNNPLATYPVNESILHKMRKTRKTALFLKEYTLFEYSNRKKLVREVDLENMFIISPNHIYDLNKAHVFKVRNSMYIGHRLAVPSKSTKKKLIGYLKAQLLNSKQLVIKYNERISVRGSYQYTSDFRQAKNQIVFSGPARINDWKFEKNIYHLSQYVHYQIITDITFPYFYSHPYIMNGNTVLLQNVTGGNKYSAIKIAKRWAKDQSNLGFYTNGTSNNDKYIIYRLSRNTKKSGRIPIFKYPDGSFAAILPL